MALDWTLIEFRPGRYARVSTQGEFLSLATEAETRAWFAAQQQAREPGLDIEPRRQRHAPRPAPLAEEGKAPSPALAPEESTPREPVPVLARPLPPRLAPPAPRLAHRPLSSLALGLELGTLLPSKSATASRTPTPPSHPLLTAGNQEAVPMLAGVPETFRPLPLEREEARPAAETSAPPAPTTATWEAGRPSEKPDAPEPGAVTTNGSQATPGEPGSPAERPGAAGEGPREASSPAGDAGCWLWVDPRPERGDSPRTFDLGAFLRRATTRFQSKPWTAGRQPGRLAAHPDDAVEDLKPLADSLGLELVDDPLVTPGTYRLGLPIGDERRP
jgi:hypothetical protein